MDERQQQIQQILQQALASSTSVLSHAAQSTGASPQLVGGMVPVMLPSVGTTNYLPGQLATTPTLMTGNMSQCVQPLLIRHGVVTSPVREGQLAMAQKSPSLVMPPRTPGATIHHMGTGEVKDLPFTHLRSQLQAAKIAESARPGSSMTPERRTSADDSEKPVRKRIKLEGPEGSPPPISPSNAQFYRRLYMESRERDMAEIDISHRDHLLELIFLEKFNGNLMDFLVWSKRPNLHIGHLLLAESLDSGDDIGEEKHINNEVKVVTTSGSTIPIVTPVAIATTLPPAITALQLQGGVPLSTTAATTTVGSPPPYTLACSGTVLPTVVNTSTMATSVSLSTSNLDGRPDDLASILGFGDLSAAAGAPIVSDHVMSSLKSGSSTTSSVSSVQPMAVVCRQASTMSLGGLGADAACLPAASHEAVVEQARQEAQVLQRIAELRRQGLWSARRLPKVQEPSRCKAHWDYVLSEMRWLSVDFAQERRWKIVVAKMLANEAVKYHKHREELERLRVVRTAGVIAHMVDDFWSHMIEMAFYKRKEIADMKHSQLLQFVLKDISPNFVPDSDSSEFDSVGSEDELYENEISDLVRESEMPLDELLAKYSGTYESTLVLPLSRTESLAEDSDDKEDDDDDDAMEQTGAGEDLEPDVVKTYSSLTELMQLAQNVHPVGHSLDVSPVNISPLSLIAKPLREYQLIAIDWLTTMYHLTGGCVLADSLGLGKKVETIGFLAHLAIDRGVWGKHLVVAPAASLPTWQTEFERWWPASKVLVYCGKSSGIGNKKQVLSSSDYQILLTSQQTLIDDDELFKNRKWKCLVVDETERAVNTDVWSVLLDLSSDFTVELTSSDIIHDPSSSLLASFLQLSFPKSCRDDLLRQLHVLDASSVKQLAMSVSLRRTESDVKSQLPSVDECIVSCQLSARQRFLYTDYVTSARKTLCGSTEHRLIDVLKLIVNLQNISDHPELYRPRAAVMPLCMDGISYRVPELINSLLGADRTKKPSADSAGEKSAIEEELLAELHFLMSPGTNTEPPSASISSTARHQQSMFSLLEPGELLRQVYPRGLDTTLRQLSSPCVDSTGPGESAAGESGAVPDSGSVGGGKMLSQVDGGWLSAGSLHCSQAALGSAGAVVNSTTGLREAIKVHDSYADELSSVLRRLRCAVTPAVAPAVQMTVRDECRTSEALMLVEQELRAQLTTVNVSSSSIILPDPKHIAADSGKLLRLNSLLDRLSAGTQRCIIFTQSMKMLSILQSFLDCRQTRYQRIDATLQATERRARIVRFNSDKRIPCLVMSTRTPWIGVDLPDVTAIIFYDAELRPDMSQHVEQFCRSLALTRDLDIYRLTSAGTVDALLLKSHCSDNAVLQAISRAHNVTLNTTIFESIDEFLTIPSQADTICDDVHMAYLLHINAGDEYHLQKQLLSVCLSELESTEDVKAAVAVHAEKHLLSGGTVEPSIDDGGRHWLDADLSDSYPLSDVEMYAVTFVEHQMEPPFGLDIKEDKMLCDEKVASSKCDIKSKLKLSVSVDVNENKNNEEDQLLLTYFLEPDQTFICDTTGQQMPFWAPPTPPQDDSDLYIDITQTFIYEPTVMFESQLPPVYVRKGRKRHQLDALGRKQKQRVRDDLPPVPRSLFDCPQTMAQRMERNAHLLKQGLFKPVKAQMQAVAAAVGAIGIRPAMEPVQDHPEWLVHEDWALLQALQSLQDLPLNLLTSSPGHTANWDLVADIVNGCSRTFRSPKQCKNRYENFIVAREEGRAVYDPSPRKLKKAAKGIYKTKSSRSMRTNQLHLQDNNKASTTLFTLRFDAIKSMAAKRTPPLRPQLSGAVGAGVKNTKHLAVLAENGINYDRPLSPVQVATMRAERIAKEKKTAAVTSALSGTDVQQAASAAAAQLPQQRPAAQSSVQQQQQLVLQPQQQAAVAAAAAATGHVILQPGQQLISAGQQVLANVDGRPQQMTIVQGPPSGSLLQPTAIVRASAAAAAAAAAGNSVMTTLARGINMTGIIVSQTIPGQTYATAINKGQTVVAPLQGQNAGQLRGMVRGPFIQQKDMAGLSVVSQPATVSTLPDGTKVMTTTSLAQNQLVVTQQKQSFVALPSLASGSVQPQLLSLSMAPGGMSATPVVATAKGPAGIQQVQLMRPKQVLQQLRSTQIQQMPQQMTSAGIPGSVIAGQQKTVTVTAPLITSMPQLRQSQFQALLRRPQQQQQPKAMPAGIAPGAIVQQIQVSKGGQILEGVQIQQVPSSLTPQTVATLMKSVTSAAGAVPNVTIAGNNTISVNITQQQKQLLAGKTTIQPHQIRHLQMQKRGGPTVQIQGTQKVAATLQQVTKLPAGTSPVIFRQQQVVVQQMTQQQLLKQNPVALAAAVGSAHQQQQQSVQHIISSVPLSAAGTQSSAVLATQLIGAQMPGGCTTTVAMATQPMAVARTLAVTFSTTSMQGATISLSSAVQQSAATTSALSAAAASGASVKLLTGPSLTTIVKSTTPVAGSLSVLPPRSATIQPVLVRTSATAGLSASPAHITLAAVSSARASVSSVAAAQAAQPVLPGIQQTVQDIVQQAQAQAQTRQPVSSVGFVAMTAAQAAAMTTGSEAILSAQTTLLSSPSATVNPASESSDPNTPQNKSSSPYVMRLRNQKS